MAIWMPELDDRRGLKYLQIVEAIAEDITSGHLMEGARLPPHRILSYQLGISEPQKSSHPHFTGHQGNTCSTVNLDLLPRTGGTPWLNPAPNKFHWMQQRITTVSG